MKRHYVNIFLFVAALAFGAYLARDAWNQSEVQSKREAAAKARMTQDEHDRANLLQQQIGLESPAGQERLARKRGYIKQGETPIGLQVGK